MSEHTRAPAFQDASTDCAICLEPLEQHQPITLSCGHRFHLACVRQQLQLAEPDLSRPLLFTGYRCAKCAAFCQHPLLDDATRSVSHLMHTVDQLMLQQARVDRLHLHPQVSAPDAPFRGRLLHYARRVYAFYQCSVCSRPYFGGTLRCAERAPQRAEHDRTCERCSPRTAAVCTDPAHTPFFEWKCRFCCEPADFVCYGATHLCARCHAEDDGRARRTAITPKPCAAPPRCTRPLRPAARAHRNGAHRDCEQLYRCAACESARAAPDAARAAERARRLDERRASRNLLFNRSGEHALRGWQQLGAMPWRVERSAVPLFGARTNFVSSCLPSAMAQVVDLRRFAREPARVAVRFAARFMARTDCPSEFRLQAALYSAHARELRYLSTGARPLQAPPDYWGEARLEARAADGACFALLAVSGKDCRFWAGNYGAKVAECSVRIVADNPAVADDDVLLDAARAGASEVPPPIDEQVLRVVHAFASRIAGNDNAPPRSPGRSLGTWW